MKIIFNPTNTTVSIQVSGSPYSVEPKSTKTVADNVAEAWVKTHNFLEVSDADKVRDIPTEFEHTEETVEETVETVKEGKKPKTKK